uniref:Sorting nexin 5 n=1 Tax=Ornithorhynchus anatinus TaxID=9258 RepID=A0A6I8P137_ORNAN
MLILLSRLTSPMPLVKETRSSLRCTPRLHCLFFKPQSFLLQDSMKTLCGYMIHLLKPKNMGGSFEYLAVFKKTVSSHEVFLQRLSSHPVLSKDCNFHVFLEYDQDLSVRRKNTKEMFGGFFKSVVKSADEVLFSGVKEVDDFFEQEKNFLVNYYNRIKDSCAKADRMTRSHKNVADDYIHTSASLNCLALEEPTVIKKYLLKVAELFEKLRKVEGRVSSDEDLKLSELLRYYMLNIEAAKDLLYRRTKALIEYENSNKALDKARLKSKDVKQAEAHQQECCQKFEQLSESAKEELISFKRKRVSAFRKNLIEMSELEIKHAKVSYFTLQAKANILI